jgi:hypothetical protein
MSSIEIDVPLCVDAYLTEEGVGIYVCSGGDTFIEKVFPFKEMMEQYLESYLIPSDPPKMHDEDRERVTELINNIFRAIDHLRKLEHDTPPWTKKDSLGFRD